MGNITLRGPDGFEFNAYAAEPTGNARGAVVVIQEIFGVNDHIRSVVDNYAAEGFHAIAPALFDRVESGVELGYGPADMERGVELAFGQLDMGKALGDVQATIDYAAEFGKVGVVGYCFGGLLTWLAASQLQNLAAASSYYGGGVTQQAAMQPECPIILHFGEQDDHIPMASVHAFIDAHPNLAVYTYAAGHGFNCDQRDSYDPEAAALARERTLTFFARHLRG